jgi:ABC-type nitrate/sulfonate/bicarbonate transport system substrate-binding protein
MKPLALSSALILLAAPAFAQDRLTVMLDWFVNPDHGPIILADALGYFEEAGLAVEWVTPADPNDPPRMVAAGRVDLAVSYQPELHLNRREGLELIRVGTLIETPLTCLVVPTGRWTRSPIWPAARSASPSPACRRCFWRRCSNTTASRPAMSSRSTSAGRSRQR